MSSQFDVTALPPSDGLEWYQLIPKHPDTDFQLVRIGFDKGELASMFLADKLNQVTQLTFTNPKRNAKFAPDLFHIRAAAGGRCDRARRQVTGATAPIGRWPIDCARSPSRNTSANRICWARARRCAARWSPAIRIP